MGYFDKMFGESKARDKARYDQLLGGGMRPSEALHTINREKNERRERRETPKMERMETPKHERQEKKKSGGGLFKALTGPTAQNFYEQMGGYGKGSQFGYNPESIFGGRPSSKRSGKKHRKGKKHSGKKGKKGKTIVIHL